MATPTMQAAYEYVTRRVRNRTIRPQTAVNERRVLTYFAREMGNRRLQQIGQADVERWLGTMTALTPGTVRGRFAIVRRFLQWLVDSEQIRRNPARLIPPPKVPKSRHRALSREQTEAIITAAGTPREMCIVILGFQLGLRRAEIAALEIGDITWGRRPSLLVHGKGGHERTVPLTDEAKWAINHYLAELPANGGPLIRGDKYPTHGVSPDWIGRAFNIVAYRAGVKRASRDGVSTHAARHTCATDVYEATGDVLAVKDLLGHESLQTTQTYVDGMNVEKLREAMEGRTYRQHVAPVVRLMPGERSPHTDGLGERAA